MGNLLRNFSKVIVLAFLFLFVAIIQVSASEVVYRTATTDLYYEGNSTFNLVAYSNPVNIKDPEGVFRPYEEITSFKKGDSYFAVDWFDKSVTFEFYTKNKNLKERFKDHPGRKEDLEFLTSYQPARGLYYYNHTMSKDKNKQPEKFGYEITTENVSSCYVEGYSLICDEQRFSFEMANQTQGLDVKVSENNVEFSGDDLNLIDPTVTSSFFQDSYRNPMKCGYPLDTYDNYDPDTSSVVGFIPNQYGLCYYFNSSLHGLYERTSRDFDLSSIPDYSSIQEATLYYKLQDVRNMSFLYLKQKSNFWNSNSASDQEAFESIANYADLCYYDYNKLIQSEIQTCNYSLLDLNYVQSSLITNKYSIGFTGNEESTIQYSNFASILNYDYPIFLNITYTYQYYPSNPILYLDGSQIWNHSGVFIGSETTDDFSEELNNALENCVADEQGYCEIPLEVHSDSQGQIRLNNLEIYYNSTEYLWNVTDFGESSTYKARVRASDGSAYSPWDESDGNFTISVGGDFTYPLVEFSDPTPANNTIQQNNDVYINLSTSDEEGDHYALLDLDSDLKTWIRMDDLNASGDPIDISAHGRNGSRKGDSSQSSEGKFGDSFNFDGNGDYIQIPNMDGGNVTQATISLWVNFDDYNQNHSVIYRAFGESLYPRINYWNTSGGVYLQYRLDGVTKTITLGGYGQTYSPGTWHNIVATFDVGAGVKLYVDGEFSNLDSSTGTYFNGGTNSVLVGQDSNLNYNLKGFVDELAFFNRTLNDQEIKALYSASTNQYGNNFTNLPLGDHSFIGYAIDEAGNLNHTETRSIFIGEPIQYLDLNSFELVYASGTERVFKFLVNNTLGSIISNINWSLDSGEDVVNSESSLDLENNEEAYFFVYHNYSSGGNYTITASAGNGTYNDEEELIITI